MNNDKITIVTAFFPLNREGWKGFERSSLKYIEYFKFWGKLKNDMIIYTTKEYKGEIEKFRSEVSANNTKLVIIDDYTQIDTELYSHIKNALENKLIIDFRLQPNNPESWNADYNYIMCLKSWCIQDAVKKQYAKGMIAWVDFGFNHNGEYYINENEFITEWKCNLSEKIHIFAINDLDDLPIYEITRRMHCYIQGNIIIAPDFLWEEFWNLIKKNAIALAKCGLVDDDQTIILMAYREKKELFELHKSEWFSQLNDIGNLKLTTKQTDKLNITKRRKLLNELKFKKAIFKYSLLWYKKLKDDPIKG